ncbi:MAG TPA: pilin [Candidatus Gracilibacteria bacterium]|nr:pilin [Candidatus Gracilibacteria bacterium]
MNKQSQKSEVKHFFKSLIVYLSLVSTLLTFAVPAFAQDTQPSTGTDTQTSQTQGDGQSSSTVEGSGFLQNSLGQINEGANLPGFETAGHAQASYAFGASNITSAIFYVVDLLKYLLGTVAVVVIIASGLRLLTAARQVEEVSTQQKENLKYAVIGLLIIIVADTMVKQVFFGEQGEVFRSQADAQLAAERGTEQLEGLYNFFQIFVGVIAILMIIISGVRMVASGGNEETMSSSKKSIMWAVIGIVLIGISELVVKDIVFPNQGSSLPDTQQATALIVSLTNFISGFIATAAVIAFMYGGYLYVIAAGREDQAGKAKKVFMGATIGLLLALAAFAIVNTFISLDSGIESVGGESASDSLPTEFPF